MHKYDLNISKFLWKCPLPVVPSPEEVTGEVCSCTLVLGSAWSKLKHGNTLQTEIQSLELINKVAKHTSVWLLLTE